MLARKCPRFNSMWTEIFHMFKVDLEKARRTRDQIACDCVDHNKLDNS